MRLVSRSQLRRLVAEATRNKNKKKELNEIVRESGVPRRVMAAE